MDSNGRTQNTSSSSSRLITKRPKHDYLSHPRKISHLLEIEKDCLHVIMAFMNLIELLSMKPVSHSFLKLCTTSLRRMEAVDLSSLSDMYVYDENSMLALAWGHCPRITSFTAAYCMLGFGSVISTIRFYPHLRHFGICLDDFLTSQANYVIKCISKQLPNLTSLKVRCFLYDLDGLQAGWLDISPLANLKLRKFYLRSVEIDAPLPKGIDEVVKISTLEELDLNGWNFTDVFQRFDGRGLLKRIGVVDNVKHLGVRNCLLSLVGPPPAEDLATAFPSLESLDAVRAVPLFEISDVRKLVRLERLQHLRMSRGCYGQDGWVDLRTDFCCRLLWGKDVS